MLEEKGKPGYVPLDREPHCPVCEAVLRYCPSHGSEGRAIGQRMPHMLQTVAEAGKVTALRAGDNWGYFRGDPIARWNPDGERMQLMEPFSYIDRRVKQWAVPKGTIVDGASIPRAFWTLVGSPLRGKYRYASIVHDYECQRRENSWQAIHFMFYEACMAGGTGHTLAKLLYYAVRHFGPRWGDKEPLALNYSQITSEELELIEYWIFHDKPNRAEIDNHSPAWLGIKPAKPRRR